MSSSLTDSKWTLARFFHLLSYLLVATGFSALVLAEQISLPVALLFILPFLVSFSTRLSRRVQLSERKVNLLTWCYLPLFLTDTFYLSGSFVPATLHLILFVQLMKIYKTKNNRDYFYLIVLAFLEILAASSLTVNVSFLVCFLIFVLLSITALICFEIKRSYEVSNDKHSAIGGFKSALAQTTPQFSPNQQRLVIRYVLGVSLLVLSAISLLGATLFFAIPRFGSGYFTRALSGPMILSGFSDRIRLGGIGTIQLDSSIVMRVRVNGDRLLHGVKWRGVALDHFDGRTWAKRTRGILSPFSEGREFNIRSSQTDAVPVDYQVLLEPCSTSYIFTVDRILRLRGNLSRVIHDPNDDSITTQAHRYGRLSYQGRSILPSSGRLNSEPNIIGAEARAACLQLPTLDRRIMDLAQSIAIGSESMREKSVRVEEYLKRNYGYSLEQSQLEQPQPLSSFLLESKSGHCEYFASAMVVMLRILGIPSRIVNGFQAGEYNEIGENYVIRGKDAHSWVEAYDSTTGWLSFDPTPAADLTTPQHPLLTTISNYLDAFELFWSEWILGYDAIIQTSLFRDLQEKSARWGEVARQLFYREAISAQQAILVLTHKTVQFFRKGGWYVLQVGLFIIGGTWLAYQLYDWIRWKRLRNAARRGDTVVAVKVYSDLLEFLHARGKPKAFNLTPKEFANTFTNPRVKKGVGYITEIYNAVRFGNLPVSQSQMIRAYQILSDLKDLSKSRRSISEQSQ